MNKLLLMKKLIIAFSAIAVSGISLISNNTLAETLYHVPGGGRWGGDAYRDSSGNYYNQDAMGGPGLYGGGTFYDHDMNAYDCGPTMCFKR